MKKIILHIGAFKTGSTALQHHLAANDSLLLENGYYYGNYFNNIKAHSNLTYGLLMEALQKEGIFGRYNSHPRFLNVAQKPDEVISRICRDSLDKDIIISHEALFADSFRTLVGMDAALDCLPIKEVNTYIRTKLYHLLSEITDDIRVVCYLRRQDLSIESQYNQICKQPWFNDEKNYEFHEFLAFRPVHLDYFPEIKEWAEIFGEKSITIKLYEKKLIQNGLIADFYKDVLGIQQPIDANIVKKEDMNLGLNPRIVKYKNKLSYSNPKLNELFYQYTDAKQYNQKEGFFDYDERLEFLKKFEESNKSIARKYFHRENLFEDEVTAIPKVKELSYNEFVEITKWILEKALS